MGIVKDGMVIDPIIQNGIIARVVAGNFGDQPSQTIHSLGTIMTADGKEVRVHVGHAVDAIILDPYGNVVLVTRQYNPGAGLNCFKNVNGNSPVGPFRCLAIISSATPLVS